DDVEHATDRVHGQGVADAMGDPIAQPQSGGERFARPYVRLGGVDDGDLTAELRGQRACRPAQPTTHVQHAHAGLQAGPVRQPHGRVRPAAVELVRRRQVVDRQSADVLPGRGERLEDLPLQPLPAPVRVSVVAHGPLSIRDERDCRSRWVSFDISVKRARPNAGRKGRLSMGAKAEALAKQFEAKAREAQVALEKLGDADWKKVTAAEKWTVGVTAHHLAGGLAAVAGLVTNIVTGAPSRENFARAALDEMNARHAKEHANCTRAETLALFQKGAASASTVIRG